MEGLGRSCDDVAQLEPQQRLPLCLIGKYCHQFEPFRDQSNTQAFFERCCDAQGEPHGKRCLASTLTTPASASAETKATSDQAAR